MDYLKNIIQSRKMLKDEVKFQQLAEEASEVCQAALKVARTLNNDNPTNLSQNEAIENLVEEISDLQVCLDIVGLSPCKEVMEYKVERLLKRLNERNEKRYVL